MILGGQILIGPKIVPQITNFDADLSSFFYFAISVFAIKEGRFFHAHYLSTTFLCSRERHFEIFVSLLSNFGKIEPSPLFIFTILIALILLLSVKSKRWVQVALGTRLQFWCQPPHYILLTQNSRLGAISTSQNRNYTAQ